MTKDEAQTEKDWQAWKSQVTEVTEVFGGLIFFPLIFLVGLGYGIRAGIVVCLEKMLDMIKNWGE